MIQEPHIGTHLFLPFKVYMYIIRYELLTDLTAACDTVRRPYRLRTHYHHRPVFMFSSVQRAVTLL